MNYANENRRIIGYDTEGVGSYSWPEYEYRCPECNCWHTGGDVTTILADGTQACLCDSCGEKVFPSDWVSI